MDNNTRELIIYILYMISIGCLSAINNLILLYSSLTNVFLFSFLLFLSTIKVNEVKYFIILFIIQEIIFISCLFLDEKLWILIQFFGFLLTNGILIEWKPKEIPIIYTIELENYTNESEEIIDCCICLDNIEKGVELSCEHKYHCSCINEWKKIRSVCPLCSREI